MSEFSKEWLARPIRENTLKAERGICQKLGVLHPDDFTGRGRYIGSFVPAASLDAAVQFVEKWASEKEAYFKQAKEAGEFDSLEADSFPNQWASIGGESVDFLFEFNFLPLTYRQYLGNLKDGKPKPMTVIKTWSRNKGRDKHDTSAPQFRARDARFIQLRGGVNFPNRDEWTKDEKGYLAYVKMIAPQVVEFLERPIPLCAPTKAFEEHTFITGTIGSGKTEVLKLLIYSAVKLENCGVLVIDPHGDMAGQIARWPEFSNNERLVYIDPEFEEGVTPRLNPFDVLGKGVSDVKQIRQFTGALEEMLGDREGAALSVYMKNALSNCLRALFAMGDKDIWDLVEFMDKKRNIGLIQQAARILPKREAAFFDGDFQSSQYDATRMSIAAKLREILSEAGPLFTGPSTFDLVGLLNQKKVVILNLAGQSPALGRLVLATVQAMALARARETGRVPVHVFVDECHKYISDATTAILEEARKFKIFLTLAQQQVGQRMNQEKKQSVLGNPVLKLIGRNEQQSLKDLAGAIGAKPEVLYSLSGHAFAYSHDKKPPIKFMGAEFLLDNTHAMKAADWEKVKAEQIAKYYVPIGGEGQPDDGTDNPLPPANDGPPYGL